MCRITDRLSNVHLSPGLAIVGQLDIAKLGVQSRERSLLAYSWRDVGTHQNALPHPGDDFDGITDYVRLNLSTRKASTLFTRQDERHRRPSNDSSSPYLAAKAEGLGLSTIYNLIAKALCTFSLDRTYA